MRKSSRTTLALEADSGHDLVICYGNPLRGDDGIAWCVAEKLIELQLELLEVIVVHQLMPELAQMVAQASSVIFVDASLEIEPGEIRLRELGLKISSKILTHHLEPEDLLSLAKTLYARTPLKAVVLSVGVEHLGYRERLSAKVENVIPKILETIQQTLATRKAFPSKAVMPW